MLHQSTEQAIGHARREQALRELAEQIHHCQHRYFGAKHQMFVTEPEMYRLAMRDLAEAVIVHPGKVLAFTRRAQRSPFRRLIARFAPVAALLSIVSIGCTHGTFQGTAPTVIADPNAPAGKTRAAVRPVLKEGERLCTEADAGSFNWEMTVLGGVLVESRAKCQAIVGISAARILMDPVTRKPQADWGKEVFLGNQTDADLAPGQAFPLSIRLDPTQCWEIHGFIQPAHVPQAAPAKGDGWDESLSLQANGYYKPFGTAVRQVWATNYDEQPDCNGGAYYPPQKPTPPPIQPLPPVPTCATDPRLCDPPAAVCPANGSYAFPPATWLQHNGEPDYHDRTAIVPVNIPPAKWIFTVTTTDDHSDKPQQQQLHEQVLVYLFQSVSGLPADPAIGPTPDIPEDKNLQATPFGPFSLPAIGGLQVVHAGPADGVDSLMIRSVAWQCVAPLPTTSMVRR